MLRSDWEVALDEVIVACEEAAEGHAEGARHPSAESEIGAFLTELARQRRQQAAVLEERLRALGKLPRTPDRDSETIRHLIERVREAVSRDGARVLLDERARDEARLLERVEAALARDDLPAGTAELLRPLRDAAAAARQRLENWQTDRGGEGTS